MLGVETDQLVLKCRELEVVILFVDGFGRTAAIGTGSARLRIDVKLVENAVLAGVGSIVDISVVANLAPQRLHPLFVPLGGGADEIVVGQTHMIPEGTEFRGDLIGELLRRLARSLGGALDLLTVLVGAGQEPGVISQHAVPPRDRVAGNGGVGVANVRMRIDVVDRGRDVELLAHSCAWCRNLTSAAKAGVRFATYGASEAAPLQNRVTTESACLSSVGCIRCDIVHFDSDVP